jgi:hypothetical protein
MTRPRAFVIATVLLVALQGGRFAADQVAQAVASDHLNGAERERQLESMRRDDIADIERMRQQLFSELRGREAEVYKKTQFRVNPSDFYGLAQAWEPAGDPVVEISVGFIRSIQMALDALTIELAFARPGFLKTYAAYVARGLARNAALATRGQPLGFIKAPGDFAELSDAEIRRLDGEVLTRQRGREGGGALAFVLAHEVGHVVQGHIAQVNLTLSQRVANEEQADKWAVDLLLSRGMMPIGGILPLTFGHLMEKSGYVSQAVRDHPPTLGRIRKIYVATLDALPRFREEIQKSGRDYDDVRREVERGLRALDEDISEDNE